MGDDQEYERFDVDNDYEGGEWINGEFFYANKRQKRAQTKDDQIYGVFAEDKSDDDGRRGKRRGATKDDAPTHNYVKPVNFVGGGVVKHGPDDTNDDNDGRQPLEKEDYDGAELERPGLGGGGLGFGGGGTGLGFAPPSTTAGTGATNNNSNAFTSATTTAGLGASSHPHGGIGFKSATATATTKKTGGATIIPPPSQQQNNRGGIGSSKQQPNNNNEEEEEEDEDEFIPTAFGRRIKQQADQRRKQRETVQTTQRVHQRTASKTAGVDVGGFEAHTKGIGAKLLSKMGWQEGKGLGKEGRGIAKPLEAKLRPRGMGMGYGDRQEPHMMVGGGGGGGDSNASRQQQGEKGEKGKVGEAAVVVDVKKEATMWKRKNAEARVKRTFKTADEVLHAAERQPVTAAGPTIIDMRGPQARVVTNLEHLNEARQADDRGDVPMPELQHNLRLLVDIAEADIQKLDARIRHQKDTVSILEKEIDRLKLETEHHAHAAQRAAHVMERLTWARSQQEDNNNGLHSLDDLATTFTELYNDYKEEYVGFDVYAVALAVVLPHFTQLAVGWSPLTEPTRLASQCQQWRPLLERPGARQHASHVLLDITASTDPYARIMLDLLLPPLRKDLTNTWDPRDAALLESFVDTWQLLLPQGLLHHIMLHLVLPRLRVGIENWNPQEDPVFLHTWIHPWLPYLGHEIGELLPLVRIRLEPLFSDWHPSDESAHMYLEPWHKVFSAKDWNHLMQHAIGKQLAKGLEELVVNPQNQVYDEFVYVMKWSDIMPPGILAQLLDAFFWDKWLDVLRFWVKQPNPDFDEITRWYLQWKTLFPENLLHNEKIRNQLNKAMDVMNRAAQGKPIPPSWNPVPSIPHTTTNTDQHHHQQLLSDQYGLPHHQKPTYHAPSTKTTTAGGGGGMYIHAQPKKAAVAEREPTLMDWLEELAYEHGVEFAPKPGRYYEGLQVYHWGGVSVVVDKAHGVLKMLSGGGGGDWRVVSLEDVVSENEKRVAAKGKKK